MAFYDGFNEKISSIAKAAGGKIKSGASYASGKISDGVSYAGEKIGEGAEYVGGAVLNTIDYAGDKASDVYQGAKDLGSSAVQKTKEIAAKGGDFMQKNIKNIPLIGEPLDQKLRNRAAISVASTSDVNTRDEKYANIFSEIDGGEKTAGIAQGLGGIFGSAWDKSSSYVLGNKNLQEIAAEYTDVKRATAEEIQNDVIQRLESGNMTEDEARLYYETELKARMDEYLMNNDMASRLKLDEDMYLEAEDKSISALYERSLSGNHSNAYMEALGILNRDVDDEVKKELVITKTDSLLGNNVEMLSKIQERLTENLVNLDVLKFESLSGIDKDSKEAKTIVRNINLLRDAQKRYGSLVFQNYQNLLLENSGKENHELLEMATDMSIAGLSNTDKAILHEQDSLVSAANMSARIASAKGHAENFNATSGWKAKSGIYKDLFIDNVRLIGEGLGFGITETFNIGKDGVSQAFRKNAIINYAIDERFETYQDLQIWGDNYEYEILDDNMVSKGLKHIIYNLDDIGEAIVPMFLTKGSSAAPAATSKIPNLAAKFSTTIQNAIKNNKAIQFSVGKLQVPLVTKPLGLTKQAMSFGGKQSRIGADDVAQGFFIQNPIIDRNTLQASTQENDVMNMWFDALGGRIFSGLQYGLGGTSKYAFKNSVGIIEAMRFGEPFTKAVDEIASQYNIPKEQASSVIKSYKATLSNISKPLANSTDFYDNVLSVMKDLEDHGIAATDYGNIANLDNSLKRYERFSNTSYFEGGLSGSNFDKQLVSEVHLSNMEKFSKTLDGKFSILGERLDDIDGEVAQGYREKITEFQKSFKEAMEIGDEVKLLEVYKESDAYMKDIFVNHSTIAPSISLYNVADGSVYTVSLKQLNAMRGDGQSIDQMVQNGIIVRQDIGDIKKGKYTFIGNNKVSADILEYNRAFKIDKNKYDPSDKKHKKPIGIRFGFPSDELYQKLLNFGFAPESKSIGVKKIGQDFKYGLSEIYQQHKNLDEWFGVVDGGIENKPGEVSTFSYLVPGKKMLDKMHTFNVNLKKSNYTVDIYNIALELGITSENRDQIMEQAIEVYNVTRSLAKPSVTNFSEMYDKVLQNFKESTDLNAKLTVDGEEMKKIIEGLYKTYKVDDATSMFFLKSLILKLGRNPQIFNQLRDFISAKNKNLGDLEAFKNVLIGDVTFKELKSELIDIYDLGDLKKEMQEIISIDMVELDRSMVKYKDLIETRKNQKLSAYGKDAKDIIDSDIKFFQSKTEALRKKREKLSSEKFQKDILDYMYTTSLYGFFSRKSFDSFVKIDNAEIFPGKILETPPGVGGIDLAGELGLTPNEISKKQKLNGNLDKEEKKLKSLANDLLPKEQLDEVETDFQKMLKQIKKDCSGE